MLQLKKLVGVAVVLVLTLGSGVGVSGGSSPESVFEEWRVIMKTIWEKDAYQEYFQCDAPEEQTLSRAYLERIFRDYSGTGIMAHAWPRLPFYEQVLKGLNLGSAKSNTQCRLKAYYKSDIERLVCYNGTCTQCMNINPSVSALLNEACHDLKSPGEPDPSRVIPVKKEELSNSSDCGWLNYDEAIKLYDNRRLDGTEFNLLTKCDASPELVYEMAYLGKLKYRMESKRKEDSNEPFRRFFEDRLQVVKDSSDRFRRATFCNPRRASIQQGAPKQAERQSWGFVLIVFENYGTRVCGPDGACVQCNDMKETDGLLFEACYPKDIVDQPGCEEPTTTPSRSAPPGATFRKKHVFAVGLAVFYAASLLLTQS